MTTPSNRLKKIILILLLSVLLYKINQNLKGLEINKLETINELGKTFQL